MKRISDITAMVVDTGLFVELARTLGKEYKKVYYCYPSWVTPFPKMNGQLVGSGFEEIETVLSPFEHFDDIDLFVFPDVGYGEMQVYFESVGKAVWGCKKGEELEFYRDTCKELMKELSLSVGKYAVIKGIDALRDYLKYNEDQWVKINRV